MVLQDVQHLAGRRYGDTRVLAVLAGLEVDHEAQGLDAGGHELGDALDHVEEVVDLARGGVGVLAVGVEVLAGPAVDVEADNHLLARLLLGRDVLRGEALEAVLAAPGEGREETLGGVVDAPASGAQVAQQALAREPHALRVGQGAGLGGLLGAGDGGEVARLGEQGVVLGGLLLGEIRPRRGNGVGCWGGDGRLSHRRLSMRVGHGCCVLRVGMKLRWMSGLLAESGG